MEIIATSDYIKAIYVIPIVALGVYFTFVYDLFCCVEFYYGATKYVMIASIIGAVFNIILNAIFIPIYGFLAAGYTTLVCYILFMIMHFVFMRRVCAKHNIKDEVYDLKMLFKFSIILLIAIFTGMFTYDNALIRLSFFIIIVIWGCLQKKHLINAYHDMKNK